MEKTFKDHSTKVFWTAGDLNLPDMDWSNMSISGNRYRKDINERLIELVNNTCQEQLVSSPTRGSNILDVFFSNRPSLTSKCSLLPGLSDHDIVSVKASVCAKYLKKPKRSFWNWKKRDNHNLHKDAMCFSSAFVSKHNSHHPIESLWKCFKDNLLMIMENNVPLSTTSNSKKQAWITSKAKKLCRLKNAGSEK